jgi:hypothetical protein
MKAFGIELRNANTIGNLYNDVDRTLSNAGLQPGQAVNALVQMQSVNSALRSLALLA